MSLEPPPWEGWLLGICFWFAFGRKAVKHGVWQSSWGRKGVDVGAVGGDFAKLEQAKTAGKFEDIAEGGADGGEVIRLGNRDRGGAL